jgi:hypothetical protein
MGDIGPIEDYGIGRTDGLQRLWDAYQDRGTSQTDDPIDQELPWPVAVDRSVEPDPLAALDSHVALIRALRAGLYPMGGHTAGGQYQKALADCMDRAATVVVTHAMLDFVLDRMPHVPFGQELDNSMLPFQAAYVVFPRRIQVPVDRAEEQRNQTDNPTYTPHILAAFDHGAWVQTASVTLSNGEGLPPDAPPDLATTKVGYSGGYMGREPEGIGYFQICSEQLIHDTVAWARSQRGGVITSVSGIAMNDYTIGAPLPVYSNGWRYGLSWDPAQREPTYNLTGAGEWERRFWLALWATLHEQTEPSRPRLPRQAVRQAARRRNGATPEVVVCNLRMLRHTDADGREHVQRPKPDWTHRWRVRPHMRTIHRGTAQERQVPVRAHVKGPDWAPLVDKDKVYRLSR